MNICSFCIVLNVLVIFLVPFLLGEVFVPHSKSGSVRNILFLLIAPMHFFDLGIALVVASFFSVTSYYIQIKQHYLSSKFVRLVFKCKNKNHMTENLILWRYFQNLIKRILKLLEEINIFNLFWKQYLTMFLIVYLLEVSLISFVLLTATDLEQIMQILPLVFCGFMFLSYLFLISVSCSNLIVNNMKLHCKIRSFHVRYRQTFPIHRDIYKMDTIDSFAR